MNRRCNLTKRVQTPNGVRYCSIVLSANGRIKPDYVLVDEKPERHPEGSYYLSWYEGRKLVRLSVGKDAADAMAQLVRKEAELGALNQGIALAESPQKNSVRRAIADAITEYLQEIKLTRTAATHSAYALALRNFTESCTKTYLQEINRVDLVHFVKHMRDRNLSDRTCHNRFEHVLTFLKAYGIEKLVKKRDWPKFVQQEPKSYDDEQLDKFFAVCNAEEKVLFEFYLMTGLRKREVSYCCWTDVDLKQGVVRVTWKPEHGFRPKDWEEREVPIPDRLVIL